MPVSSKEEEIKALQKIKRILEGLGEDSYLAAAFDGCLEVAEDSIKDDFLCSLKQVAEKERKDKEYFSQAADALHDELDKKEKENDVLKKQITNSTFSPNELDGIMICIRDCKDVWKEKEKTSAERIVQLADHPDTDVFTQAVMQNRNSKRVVEQLTALEQKVKAIIENQS